ARGAAERKLVRPREASKLLLDLRQGATAPGQIDGRREPVPLRHLLQRDRHSLDQHLGIPGQHGVYLVDLLRRKLALRMAKLESLRFGKRSEEHTSELQSPYDLVCR